MSASKDHGPEPSAQEVLASSLAWYRKHAWRARVLYHADEVAVLILAALMPITAELDALVPALLGAAVVVLTGLRSIFRWHDDWMRFTEASSQLVTERELHRFRVGPYNMAGRDQRLIRQVRDIETAETQGWLRMRRAMDISPATRPDATTDPIKPASLGIDAAV